MSLRPAIIAYLWILLLFPACPSSHGRKGASVTAAYRPATLDALPEAQIETEMVELEKERQELLESRDRLRQEGASPEEIEGLEARIATIEAFLQRGQAYLTLNAELKEATSAAEADMILRKAILQGAAFYRKEAENLLSHRERPRPSLSLHAVRTAFQNGDHRQVIRLVEGYRREGRPIAPEIEAYYGLSLAQLGQREAAREILEPLVRLPAPQGYTDLLRLVGDFFFEEGEPELARAAYGRALQEIELAGALREKLLGRQAHLGVPPLPAVAGDIPQALAKAEEALSDEDLEASRELCLAILEETKGETGNVETAAYRQRAEELLAEIDRRELAAVQNELARAKEAVLQGKGYDAARQILLNYLGANPYTPYRQEIEDVLADFDREEAQQAELQAKASRRSYQEIFNAANQAFDEGRYEEAIENYRLLAQVEGYRDQVAFLLPESIDRLVKERRSTASRLFA
ncbi:MAG: hypothetical protein D6795_11135, partial [Deltaproteobacteria bacterium]